jgi:chorismate dehydratase
MEMDTFSSKLTLGRIGFLNVLPIYYPLENGIVPHPFSIIPGVPSHLNGLISKGLLDISPVSSIEYARHAGLYYMVPDLSISSFGEVKSVLLLSRDPMESLSGKKILVSSQSHTSVGLLKVLSRLRFGLEPVFEAAAFSGISETAELPDAFLAIGDEALRLKRSGIYPHVLDLGAAWYDWTGLPFVFAVWVVRKKAIEEKNGNISSAIGALLASKRWGRENIEQVCAEAARAGVLGMEELREYYQCLQFNLNERERKGLEQFYSYLFEIGELERVPDLEIYTPLASVA